MKKLFFLFAFLITSGICFSQKEKEYFSFIKKADSLLQVKDYKNATQFYTSAFKSLGWKGYKYDRFHAAQAWAMTNVSDSAFDCLNRIVKKRLFTSYDSIANEITFKSLHNDKRWQPLLDYLKLNQKYIVPKGWFVPQAIDEVYIIGLDKSTGRDGRNAVTILCTAWEKGVTFGNLMQNFSPEKYIGTRVRMSAWMKSKDVTQWAAFWMRVDQAGSSQYLSFDNMLDGKEKRPIKGTTDWKKYEIVLDVPEKASNIAFGTMMFGNGQIWIDDFNFEVVDKTVPTTGKEEKGAVNLNFEDN